MPDGYVRGMPRVTPRTGGGITPPDRIFTQPGGEVIADEFDNHKIDAAWTRVDKSSSSYVTWTEGGGVMSVFHTSGTDTGGDMHALMRELPAGATYPFVIETYFHGMVQYNTNYMMMGLVFADSLSTSTAEIIAAMPYTTSSSDLSMYQDLRSGTGYNLDTVEQTSGLHGHINIGHYIQLRWTAANTFDYRRSSDGLNWTSTSSASFTLTPTHAGVWCSNWANARPFTGAYEYFRAYATDDPTGNIDIL